MPKGSGPGGGGGSRGGSKGGKGPKPQFTRVIPKFLQKYETMLTGPKPSREGPDDEVFRGGEVFTGSAKAGEGGGSSSGMPGKAAGNRAELNETTPDGGRDGGRAARTSGGGGGSGGGAFDDYDEEEVAALEAYMKTHPSKAEDREALRRRVKELSTSIGTDKVSTSGGESGGGDQAMSGSSPLLKHPPVGASVSVPPAAEVEIEYTDASGKLKFNKRPPSVATQERIDGTTKAGGKREKKKARLEKLAKLDNAKLLSFGDDEDG